MTVLVLSPAAAGAVERAANGDPRREGDSVLLDLIVAEIGDQEEQATIAAATAVAVGITSPVVAIADRVAKAGSAALK